MTKEILKNYAERIINAEQEAIKVRKEKENSYRAYTEMCKRKNETSLLRDEIKKELSI